MGLMKKISTLRLSGLKAWICSGLTLSSAFLPRLKRQGLAPPNGSRGIVLLLVLVLPLLPDLLFGLSNEEIQKVQSMLIAKPLGERIVFWAEKFVGTPYDPDPLGAYVTRATVVADERVDCMYLTFRVVELSLTRTPGEAIQIALDKRFHTRGILRDGKVLNYDNRFEYGEDMIESRKWGDEITGTLGRTARIRGSRGRETVDILPTDGLLKGKEALKSGDLLFFIGNPDKRSAEEIVAHIGIVKVESRQVYLIHASGTKGKGGAVKKVLLEDYLSQMPFVGVKVTRLR
jgi:hypothetical protein